MDDLNTARDIVNGILLSIPIWMLIIYFGVR
jgi:hypothetical protein